MSIETLGRSTVSQAEVDAAIIRVADAVGDVSISHEQTTVSRDDLCLVIGEIHRLRGPDSPLVADPQHRAT